VSDTYRYKVRDRAGKVIEGQLDADSVAVVASKLRQQGYIPVEIDRQASGGLKGDVSIPGLSNRVKTKDLAVFSRQFSTMIDSGLTLVRSLAILSEQTDNAELARVVGEVRNDVESGTALSTALAKHPKVFNKLYVSMVRAGETGGVLDDVLLRLADTIEKQVQLRQKVKSAMTYPVMAMVMILGITAAMLVFIVPMFQDLYKELGGTLPLPTQVLLGLSSFVTGFGGFVIIAGAIGGTVFLRRWHRTDAGRAALDRFKLKVPIFGKIVHKTALARFARTFSALLRSGVPILEALDIVTDTVNNSVLAAAVIDVKAAVKRGDSLAKPLAEHPVFPPMVVQMMAVGEETGALDTMLEKIADFYDDEVEATVDSLTSLIEPLLVGVMGIGVGGMLIALYMPMFNMINLVQ
jgi:type IV pilus assembly protein PilC